MMNRRDFLKQSIFTAGALAIGMNVSEKIETAQAAKKNVTEKLVPYLTLNNGTRIPQLGFGTWTLKENTTKSVRIAAESGYRLFDTAQGYGNERETWEGIKQSGLKRKDVFITTKISPDNMRKPPQNSSIDESIEKLGGEYIDLMLIHWPVKESIPARKKSMPLVNLTLMLSPDNIRENIEIFDFVLSEADVNCSRLRACPYQHQSLLDARFNR